MLNVVKEEKEMIKECNKGIIHDINNFNIFCEDFTNNNNLSKHNMKYKKYTIMVLLFILF